MRRHADALAALGRVEALHRVLDEIEAAPGNQGYELVEPIEVLDAYGHDDAVRGVVKRVIHWFEAKSTSEAGSIWRRHWYGRALFLAGRRDEALEVLDGLVEDAPGNIVNRTARAYVAANLGDTAQASLDLEWFEQTEFNDGQAGSALYHRGIVKAALGHLDEAVELMRSSFDDPIWGYRWIGPTQIFTHPLREYGPYQELMRPKG